MKEERGYAVGADGQKEGDDNDDDDLVDDASSDS